MSDTWRTSVEALAQTLQATADLNTTLADCAEQIIQRQAFETIAEAMHQAAAEVRTSLASTPYSTAADWGLAHAGTLQPAAQGEEQEIRDILSDMNAGYNFHVVRRQAATEAGPWKPAL